MDPWKLCHFLDSFYEDFRRALVFSFVRHLTLPSSNTHSARVVLVVRSTGEMRALGGMDFDLMDDSAGAGRHLLNAEGEAEHEWWNDNHAQVRRRRGGRGAGLRKDDVFFYTKDSATAGVRENLEKEKKRERGGVGGWS